MAVIPHIERRLLRAVLLSAPVVVIEMSRHLLQWPELTHAHASIWQWLMAGISGFIVFFCGWPLLEKGWQSFLRRKLNMFSLIAPGILITYGYSMLAMLFPELFPASFKHEHGVPVYFEAAAMITTLVLLGQFIESRAEHKTGSALEALARLVPSRTCVVRNGIQQWIVIDELVRGDLVQLRAGDRVPMDGSVQSGEASLEESMITGESIPVLKTAGMDLIGGTLVKEGAVLMKVERIGDETVLSRIIAMVKAAQESRAPIQRIADRVTGRLVPFVMLIAVCTLVVWWQIGPSPALWYGMLHAVTVLMITCPCALGLATPLSIVTGIGRGAIAGILIRDAASLEKMASINLLVLDKTGTVTTGKPELHACIPRVAGNESWLLKLTASLEHLSHHPLASAIVEGAANWGLTLAPVTQFHSQTGSGIGGVMDGHTVLAGNRAWLTHHGVMPVPEMDAIADKLEMDGRNIVWVSVDGACEGIIAVSDKLKLNAAEAMRLLKNRGIRLVMITGDTENAAKSIARQLRVDEVIASVRPEEKAGHVTTFRQQGYVVGMVGDGINDGPALATADVGIAVGTGVAVAVSSGQINLLNGDMISLVNAIDLSRAVLKNIRQNLFFAFIYNAIMIPIAAGALFPWTGLMLTPMLASAAMSASSITVILNALRLKSLPLITPDRI